MREGSEADARAALDTLCRAYWHPLYCVARREGLAEHDARDAVQGFFECLLRRETFATANASLGKLRQLLLTSFDNFLTQQWHKARRQKRGGGVADLELTAFMEADKAEERFLRADSANLSIEVLYNREWANAVLERSLAALRNDYIKNGWQERYELLVGPLLQQESETSLAELAAKAGVTAGALRVTLHRMRAHYREKIERELAATLDTDDRQLIRLEMADLFKAFS